MGTCVLQHKGMPPRPAIFDGVVLVIDDATVTEPELRNVATATDAILIGISVRVVVCTWELRYTSHDAAEAAVPRLQAWLASRDSRGFACLAYNDRAYDDRGWTVFEESVTKEVLGMRLLPGFESVRAHHESIGIAKAYEISRDPNHPTSLVLDMPQKPQDVRDAIYAAHFTNGADRDGVCKLYERYRAETFAALDVDQRYVLYDDNSLVDMVEYAKRLGGATPARPLRLSLTASANASEEDGRHRQLTFERNAMLTLLVHTSVVGLVQFCDYVSDILCLVQFKRQGNDESFVAGLTAISLSVAISYALAILGIAGTAQERQQRMGLLLGILILAPLNLHLLWVGYCCSVLLKCGLLPSLQTP